jgi:TonB-linked SusC/RagA family outer membrane protein
MKITLQFLKICCLVTLLAPVGATAQPTTSDTASEQNATLTMNVVKKPLEKVLANVSKQTGLDVHYDRNEFNTEKLVSINCKNLPVKEVLAEITDQTGLHFSFLKNKLIVSATSGATQAQVPQKIQGTVKDSTGMPLIGVSIGIKGTSKGVQSDVNGVFSIDASAGDILVFTYIGYTSKEITVGNESVLNVVLKTDAKTLTEVVVTALGISRKSTSLTYDQQTVSGKELQVAKDPSFVNSLTGKVSGLTIQQSSSGAGGSTKAILRGNKSLSQNNNVLYVVDGIPLSQNTTSQPNGGIYNFAPEGGDGISNINPDDIESISVLKGASASALYGSQAANGVILITTKKGKAGTTSVNFSSNTTFSKAVSLPQFQNSYGEGDNGVSGNSVNSWGAKISTPGYDPKNFFNTGHTLINSISLSTGTEKNQTYVSYSNTNSTGIETENKFNRNNVSIRNITSLYDNKLNLDANVNYIQQGVDDRPTVGTYFNPLTGLYLFPRGQDFAQYKNYEVFDADRNLNVQNWPFQNLDYQQNPYWIQNRNKNHQGLSRILASFSAKYNITSWINFQARIKVDRTSQTYNQDLYAGTTGQLSGNFGKYTYNQSNNNQVYSDALLNMNKKFGQFNLVATLGASLQDNQTNATGFSGNLAQVDNYFNVGNVDRGSTNFTQDGGTRAQTQSVFASANLGYKDFLFLEVTGRNDWSSALSFTNHESFFYPSVGLTDVISNMVKMPDWISFSKVRASYTEVGNSIQSYISTNPAQYPVGYTGISLNPAEPLLGLKPERTKSFEIGTEWRFFNDKLSFDATYYRTNTYNQLFTVGTTVTSAYSTLYINAGDVQNHGFEGSLSYKGPIGGALTWSPTVTFSLNRNKIVSLFNYTDPSTGLQKTSQYFVLPGPIKAYSLQARPGQPYGELYAKDFARDANGKIQVGTDGTPVLEGEDASKYTDVGNSNPSFLLGFNNTFRYKFFDMSFLVDGRFGGKVLDMTEAYLDQFGVSPATAAARDNGGVLVNGVKVDAQKYYQTIGGPDGALTQYAFSATNVRLREASLGYTIPGKLFNNSIKNIRVALVARNLFFFYKKAPYDPDVALSTDNGSQGIDIFGQPSVRTYGFNISVGL